MKKFIFICLVSLLTTIQTNAQMHDTSNMSMHKVNIELLLQKAKSQKTTAWILLAGGTGLAIAGLAIIAHDASNDAATAGYNFAAALANVFTLGSSTYTPQQEHKHSAAGPILAIAGTGAMLGSIPLFIASGKNRRNANLMLKDETVFFNPLLNIKKHLLSIGLKINL